MEINVRAEQGVTVVQLSGELTWKSAPEAEEQIKQHVQPGCMMILDMSGVSFMASAGLRLLLKVYRTVSGNGGRVMLVGVSDEIRQTMEVTGFLDFFALCDSVNAAITKLTS
jgi:anti-sigma B factor antagonist